MYPGNKRALILTDGFPPDDVGGAERIAFYHAHALKEAGFEVAVFTSQPSSQALSMQAVLEDGIQVYHPFRLYPLSRGDHATRLSKIIHMALTLRNVWIENKLLDVIREFKPDIIHAHHIPRISYGAFANAVPAIPHIITFHGYQYECPKGGLCHKNGTFCTSSPVPCVLYAKLMHKILDGIDRIVAISHFIQERLTRCGYAPSRVVYLPNGVPDLEARSPAPQAKSKEVLYVGRIAENKGLRELIMAFRDIADPAVRLRIVGSGDYWERLKGLCAEDSRIVFAGRKNAEEVAACYREARVVVVPSLWHEVMNTVICEAQSWARTVIATDVGGNSDLINPGVSGYLCPPGDVPCLKNAMLKLLSDDEFARTMGEAGFEHVKRFTMSRHIKSILNLYQELGV